MSTLNCSSCSSRYDGSQREPVVLPCGHTYCDTCAKKSNDICPACQKSFENDNVKKNNSFYSAFSDMTVQSFTKREERCATHKREIDRFCKPCFMLMCSVCQCSHARDKNSIISDENLREETEKISKSYHYVDKAKEDLIQRKNGYLEKKIREIEETKASDSIKIMESAQEDFKRVEAEKEAVIKNADKEANKKNEEIELETKRKKAEVELQRKNIHNRAEEVARKRNKEIESRSAVLQDSRHSEYKKIREAIQMDCKILEAQFETLEDLSKYEKTTLEDCLTIYKLEQKQRTRLEEFLKISKCDIDSLLAPKKFKVGESIDFMKKDNEWVTATVKNIRFNQIVIQFDSGKLEQLDIQSSRLLNRWKKGSQFQIGHSFLYRKKGNVKEVRVVKRKQDQIKISYQSRLFSVVKSKWISKDSERILEVDK